MTFCHQSFCEYPQAAQAVNANAVVCSILTLSYVDASKGLSDAGFVVNHLWAVHDLLGLAFYGKAGEIANRCRIFVERGEFTALITWAVILKIFSFTGVKVT